MKVFGRRRRVKQISNTEGTETTTRRSRNQTQLQRLNRLRKNAVSDLQGLKPLKKMQTLCRAYPSFVGMKRHDPQNLRLFPQPVKPIERNFASGGLKPGAPRRFKNSARGATNLMVRSPEGAESTESTKTTGMPDRLR